MRCVRAFLAGALAATLLSATPAGAGSQNGNTAAAQPVYLNLTLNQLLSDSLQLERHYLRMLQSASDSIFKSEFEAEFLLILNEKERNYYESLPTLQDKKDFIVQYWRAYNPDPLLPQNDRLLDHIRRCAYARTKFPSPEPPYVDDRGKYFIKYGQPTIRYVDPGGIRRIALFSPGIYEQIERFYTMGTAPLQLYSVPANESWGYENVSRNFVVHFVWKGQSFKEVNSLSEIVRSRRRANLAWQWSDLVKKRASISPIMAEAAATIESFEVELMHMAFSGNSGFKGERVTTGTAHDKIIQKLEKSEEEIQKFRTLAPPASYDPINAINSLTFTPIVSQFRDGASTRLAIQFFVPIENNLIDRYEDGSRDTISLELGGMLRSRVFLPLDTARQIVHLPLNLAAERNLAHATGMIALRSRPQSTELTLQLRDLQNKKLGFSKEVVQLRAFSQDRLEMSDIQFFAPAQDEVLRRLYPIININGLDLIPYPSPIVFKNLPLYCYFEIYNLKNSGIQQSYEIAYTVSSKNSSRTLLQKLSRLIRGSEDVSISLRHAQPLNEDTAVELIALDLSQLENDTYTLEITVSDPANSNIRTSQSRRIVVAER